MKDTHAGQFGKNKSKSFKFLVLKEMCIMSTVDIFFALSSLVSICAALSSVFMSSAISIGI